jgi:hypothetical protein
VRRKLHLLLDVGHLTLRRPSHAGSSAFETRWPSSKARLLGGIDRVTGKAPQERVEFRIQSVELSRAERTVNAFARSHPRRVR